eukprot:3622558-Amphidinium_carterae.1
MRLITNGCCWLAVAGCWLVLLAVVGWSKKIIQELHFSLELEPFPKNTREEICSPTPLHGSFAFGDGAISCVIALVVTARILRGAIAKTSSEDGLDTAKAYAPIVLVSFGALETNPLQRRSTIITRH